MRAAIRQELRSERVANTGVCPAPCDIPAAASAAQLPAVVPSEDPGPTPQQLEKAAQSYDQCRATLNDALRGGRWTADHEERWLALLSDLTADQHEELVAARAMAINSDRLTLWR